MFIIQGGLAADFITGGSPAGSGGGRDILLFLTDCFVYAGLIGRVQGDGALAPRRGHST